MPQFFRVTHAVVREGHNAVSTEKVATAFRTFPRCLQVLGENEVCGLKGVKHRDLRETLAWRQGIDGDGYAPVFGGTKHSTRP
jgi:hypothetical protein